MDWEDNFIIMEKNVVLKEVLFFPFKVLNKDRVLWIWIIATLLAGFFTIFSDLLLGKAINETFNQGIIYIFSITLLIPVISDSIIYLCSEDKKAEAEINFEHNREKKLLPIIKKHSITTYLSLILFFDIMVMLVSTLLYLGKYKSTMWIQCIIGIVSLYITFYYFCLNRVSQYPQNYNEYIKNEQKGIEILENKEREASSFTNDDGNEVAL